MSEPWGQLPDEGSKAFAAFAEYRDMGSGRSLEAVRLRCAKSAGLIDRWSRVHGWVARSMAWDQHLDAERRRAHEAEVRQMSERYARIAGAASGKLVARLASLNPDELKAGDIGPLLRTLWDVESKARGVADRLVLDATVTDSSDWHDLRGAIIRALSAHPDALADVLEAIGGNR
jgi:hypothetical protein